MSGISKESLVAILAALGAQQIENRSMLAIMVQHGDRDDIAHWTATIAQNDAAQDEVMAFWPAPVAVV